MCVRERGRVVAAKEKKFVTFIITCWLVWTWGRIWLRSKLVGCRNIPDEGGCIVASNHVSYLDPALLGAGVRHRIIRFMARDTLMDNGFMKWFFTRLHIIPIDR